MVPIQKIKQYFWYVFGVLGVVFFWVGVWDGVGYLPYIENPLISFAIGLVMFSFSGVIFKEASLFGTPLKPVERVLHKVHSHPKRHEFHIRYKDKIIKKDLLLPAKNIKGIEKGFLVFLEGGKEVFVPLHRISEILHKKKTHWKA